MPPLGSMASTSLQDMHRWSLFGFAEFEDLASAVAAAEVPLLGPASSGFPNSTGLLPRSAEQLSSGP